MRTLLLSMLVVTLGACSDRERPADDDPHAAFRGGATGAESNAGNDASDDSVLISLPAGLKLEVPGDWTSETPGSSMRQAQFRLPVAQGDGEAPELVVFHFPGGAGTIEANVQRWCGQFRRDDGSDPCASVEAKTDSIAGFRVTTLEIAGRYVAETSPGSGERVDKPDWLLLGAIIETDHGPFYFKATGPQRSVAAQRAAFRRVLESAALAP